MFTSPFMALPNDVSLAVALTILSVPTVPEIAAESVSVALSPLLLIAVIWARPRTELSELLSTAM